jgi:hypothetical protein
MGAALALRFRSSGEHRRLACRCRRLADMSSSKKIVLASRQNQHTSRVCFPESPAVAGESFSELNVCPLRARFRAFAKELIQCIMRRDALKAIEATMLGKIFSRPHEPAPSRAGERTAHTDPPHSQCCEVGHR